MTTSTTAPGLLLPLDTLTLLGAGDQGAAAARTYMIATSSTTDFEADFASMAERLEQSDDIEAPAKLAVSRLIVEVARRADCWVSVRAQDGAIAPAIILSGGGAALAAVLHGAVVEYAFGGAELLERVVRGALAAGTGSAVDVTLFDGETPRAVARVTRDSADIACPDATLLAELSAAATHGLEALAAALTAPRGTEIAR